MTAHYDLVVVGGGIHGVGVAQAAAARGLSVLVLEKRGLAAGTSSRSSKLVHGGLRYLERGRIGLVRRCLRERELLLRLAPDLVRRARFFLPVYRAARHRPWVLRAGLSVYAMLGALKAEARFTTVPRRTWGALDGLITEGLEVVFSYHDAQTDDAMLTAAVMRSAETLGAELAVPARLTGATLGPARCEVEYRGDGHGQSCTAAVLVNAAGPWVHEVLEVIRPAPPRRLIDLVQGAHILVRGPLTRGIYYLEHPADGRAVLVMPWQAHTLVGTTETLYAGAADAVEARAEEKAYLAGALQHYFPRYLATAPGAIRSAFAGLRVLPRGPGPATGRSRETVLEVASGAAHRQRPRLLTIYGGKLTAYRATAEAVMRRLGPSLPARRRRADTRTLPLVPP